MADEKPIKQNTIERSKSARASCKDCGGVIAKGEPRFCLVDFKFSEHGSYKFYHLGCAHRRYPRELAELMAERGDDLEVPRAEIEAATGAGGAPPRAKEAAPVVIAAAPDWLAKTKAVAMPDFAQGIEPPRTKEGHALDEATTAKLLFVMKDTKGGALLPRFDEWLDPVSLRDFTWRLFDRWANGSGHMKDKWVFRAVARKLDDAGAMHLGQLVETWIRTSRRIAAEAGLELLEECATPSALLAIQALAQRFHYKGAYNIAAGSLARVAKKRGVELEDLEDTLVPTLGLDAEGARVFDYGPRKFELRISNELRVEVVMEDGKTTLRGLPPPRKSDDVAKVDAARRSFEHLKLELEKTLRVQTHRLELALSTGRLWDSEAWERHLWRHPVLEHVVKRLVWASFDESGEPGVTFIIDESGKPMNVDLENIDLPEGRIGLVHPAEIDQATRGAWGTILSDFHVIQPLLQLARSVRTVPPTDADGDALTDYAKRPVGPGPLHGVLNQAGWIKSAPDDMRVLYFHKRFETQGVTAVIHLDPGLLVTGGDEAQTPKEAFFIREKAIGYLELERVPLTDVPRIAISEVLFDLDSLANAADGDRRD